MSNGIRSLPRYQNGSATSPDPEEERIRQIWQLIAEKTAPFRPDYTAELPVARPDTLKGGPRRDMMDYFASYGADTTQISQVGISKFLQGDEYRNLLGLASQMREQYNRGIHPRSEYRLPSQRVPSVATHGGRPYNTSGDYFGGGAGGPGRPGLPGGGGGEPFPVLSPEEIASLTPEQRSLYERGVDSIRLNILNSLRGQHGRGSKDKFGVAAAMTKKGWEQEPEEALREILAHELGHSLGYGEQGSDDFAAVVQAVRSASPDASFEDVLDAAQRIYWSDSNAYKHRRAEGRQTGRGSYEDPFVYDPQYIQDIKEQQNIEMRPWLEKVLATPAYADHPIHALEAERIELERLNNRGWLEKFSDKVRQGIGSLWR